MAARITLICVLLSFFTFSFAEISNENFIKGFKKPFLTNACNKDGVVRRCFKIDNQQCRSNINQVYSVCKTQMKKQMPTVVKTVYESRMWGSKLAMCVVQQLKVANEKLFYKNVSNCSGIK